MLVVIWQQRDFGPVHSFLGIVHSGSWNLILLPFFFKKLFYRNFFKFTCEKRRTLIFQFPSLFPAFLLPALGFPVNSWVIYLDTILGYNKMHWVTYENMPLRNVSFLWRIMYLAIASIINLFVQQNWNMCCCFFFKWKQWVHDVQPFFLMCCWIWFPNILWRIFASMFIKKIGLNFFFW